MIVTQKQGVIAMAEEVKYFYRHLHAPQARFSAIYAREVER